VVVKNKLNNSYYHEQSVTLHLGYRCSRYDTYTGARVSRYDVITLLLIARAPHLTHSPVGRPRPVNDVEVSLRQVSNRHIGVVPHNIPWCVVCLLYTTPKLCNHLIIRCFEMRILKCTCIHRQAFNFIDGVSWVTRLPLHSEPE